VSGQPVRLLSGRFGPYVTDGEVNASLPKGSEPSEATLESAVALLKARAEAGPSKRPARKRVGAAKAKKATKKKS
jgi:DNA topoisomerase-1